MRAINEAAELDDTLDPVEITAARGSQLRDEVNAAGFGGLCSKSCFFPSLVLDNSSGNIQRI